MLDALPHYIDVIKRRLKSEFGSKLAHLKAYYWGVQIGVGFKVHGKIHFRRLPKSTIAIGNQCRFNSSNNSNLIGVNRPCMISTIQKGAEIKIGDNCGFSGTVITAFQFIEIKNNVRIGANTLISDADWHLDDYRSGPPKPVIIESGVWLGEGVKVLKGVRIGENSLIGAGSIVVKSIPANVIAGGNPCKVLSKF